MTRLRHLAALPIMAAGAGLGLAGLVLSDLDRLAGLVAARVGGESL